MKETNYKFPFIGAGEASYFEWAEVHVIFKEEPDTEQKKKIKKNVPFPINDICWNENSLRAASGQFAHVDIATSYKTKDGIDPDDMNNWEDERWFFAASSQVSEFNKDIERWLDEIHEILPILVAYRAEDCESGGTEFSGLHRWSIKKIDTLLPTFDDIVEKLDYDSTRSYILNQLLCMKEEKNKLDDRYMNYLHPVNKEVEAFFDGNPEPLKNIGKSDEAVVEETFNLLMEKFDIEQTQHRKLLVKNADLLISLKKIIPEDIFEYLCFQIWLSAFNENKKDLMDKVPKSSSFGNRIASKAYKLMTSKEFKKSIQLFEMALNAGGNDLSRYCNALYVLQNDNTGFPVDADLNRKFLSICLPYAPKDPAIFLNACCLYVEMGEYDTANEMVKKALEYNYDDFNLMYDQINTKAFFKEFRKKTDVLKLLEDYKSKL